MEVRTQIGWKAGQIEDVAEEVAHQMIADGRATDPRDEDVSMSAAVTEPAPVLARPADSQPVSTPKAKSKRAK